MIPQVYVNPESYTFLIITLLNDIYRLTKWQFGKPLAHYEFLKLDWAIEMAQAESKPASPAQVTWFEQDVILAGL